MSNEEIANVSDGDFKDLVINMLTEPIKYTKKKKKFETYISIPLLVARTLCRRVWGSPRCTGFTKPVNRLSNQPDPCQRSHTSEWTVHSVPKSRCLSDSSFSSPQFIGRGKISSVCFTEPVLSLTVHGTQELAWLLTEV